MVVGCGGGIQARVSSGAEVLRTLARGEDVREGDAKMLSD